MDLDIKGKVSPPKKKEILYHSKISFDDYSKCLIQFLWQTKWTNKERVLVFSSRGISYRGRHLMNDMRTLMPHAKAGMSHRTTMYWEHTVHGFIY